MAIYLDDEPATFQGTSLGQLLAEATEGLRSSGRVVVEIMLDGRVLNADALGERQDEPVIDQELRLTSADPKELAVVTLSQIREHLPQAGALHEQAAEQLQQDNAAEALKNVASAIQVWMQTQEAVLGAAGVVGLSLDEVKVDDEPMTAFTDELIEQLNGLKDLIVAGDTVAMADTLAYEWPPIVHRWDRLIEVLIQRIEAI